MSKYSRKIVNSGNSVQFSLETTIGPKGLVRIGQQFCDEPAKITIVSNQGSRFEVSCVLDRETADREHNWVKSGFKFVDMPFWTDVIYDVGNDQFQNDDTEAIRAGKYPGGNRVLLDIQTGGEYIINIPHDADLETDLPNNNIIYDTDRRTELSVDCYEVNICGDSGYSQPGRESWAYYGLGSRGDPKTQLKTKGCILLTPLQKIARTLDPVHAQVWSGV